MITLGLVKSTKWIINLTVISLLPGDRYKICTDTSTIPHIAFVIFTSFTSKYLKNIYDGLVGYLNFVKYKI